jgi:beta-fructofuranosidase
VDGPGDPVDLDRAVRMTSEDLYVGRVVDSDQGPRFLAFENRGEDGRFTGGVTDPLPVAWSEDGAGLELAADADIPSRWRP